MSAAAPSCVAQLCMAKVLAQLHWEYVINYKGNAGGAFCPASAWIRESRSRQIQLKFEVRFACSPQCSSLLQHVAHGGLHRWRSLRRLHLADCSFALLSAFVLMENSSSYPVLIAEMQQRPHTHTRKVSLARLCAGHVCGNKCPVSVSTRAVPRYVLAPTQICQSSFVWKRIFRLSFN